MRPWLDQGLDAASWYIYLFESGWSRPDEIEILLWDSGQVARRGLSLPPDGLAKASVHLPGGVGDVTNADIAGMVQIMQKLWRIRAGQCLSVAIDVAI